MNFRATSTRLFPDFRESILSRIAVERIASLQALRALAALALALAHFYAQFLQKPGDDSFGFLGIGVDVFFVTSGFIMLHLSWDNFGSAKNALQFFRRRLARIVPLYWGCTFLFAFYILLLMTFEQAQKSWALLFKSLLFIPAIAPNGGIYPFLEVGWTLNFEMFFYMCFALCLLLSRSWGIFALMTGLIGLCIAGNFFILPFVLQYWSNLMILEFLFGVALAFAYRMFPPIPRALIYPLTGITVVLSAALYFNLLNIPFTATSRTFVWGAFALFAVACAVYAKARTPRALEKLGDASYAIYLIHPLIIHLSIQASGILRTTPLAPLTKGWSAVIACLCATIVASVIVHTVFERPLTRLLNGNMKRRFATVPQQA